MGVAKLGGITVRMTEPSRRLEPIIQYWNDRQPLAASVHPFVIPRSQLSIRQAFIGAGISRMPRIVQFDVGSHELIRVHLRRGQMVRCPRHVRPDREWDAHPDHTNRTDW